MTNLDYDSNKPCEACGTLITMHPTDPYGAGDAYTSCRICGWFSEMEDERPVIKQGLDLIETVDTMQNLRELYDMTIDLDDRSITGYERYRVECAIRHKVEGLIDSLLTEEVDA